jgi:hypothetical protein
LLDSLDRRDGTIDQSWLGNNIRLPEGPAPWNTYSNPAWVRFQTDVALSMIRSGYGADRVPDLFLTNFKMSDLAGHAWGVDSPETRAVLRAQDAALGRIVRYLDSSVKDYVLVLTADHGSAPLAGQTGAWPISTGELIDDLNDYFDVPRSSSLVESSSAYGLYIRREVADQLGVTDDDIARYLNDYTLGANSPESSVPEDYEERVDERIFSAAFPGSHLQEVMDCAFRGTNI